MLRGNTVPQPESFRILSLAFHNWLCPSDSDEALFWILMRMRHIEYLNCNHKDAAFMEMSSIQVTDLKIHTGTNGKDQSNLHLEAGKKQHCFLLNVTIGVGMGDDEKRKNHAKISVKILKPGLLSERFTKGCLNPLLTTEQTNSSPGPSVWPPCNLVCTYN